MGIYKYIREIRRKKGSEEFKEMMRKKILKRREEEAIVRIERPTNLPRARALGRKPIQGIILVRVRVRRGGRRKSRPSRRRRTKNQAINAITPAKSLQRIAEERAARKYPGLEVLNSYRVGEDGEYVRYEVILVDPSQPTVRSRPEYARIAQKENRGRAFRGLTSAGKKGRGLRNRGLGAEKVRPSVRANRKRTKRFFIKTSCIRYAYASQTS